MTDIFQEVKGHVSFEEVAQHWGITFGGRDKRGLCPFHDDHHPSLSLLPDGEAAHCFPCSRTVDVIDLEFELGNHVSKLEAARGLIQRYHLNIPINGYGHSHKREEQAPHDLLLEYCTKASETLLQNEAALKWFKEKKGVTQGNVREYLFGFIPGTGLPDKTILKSNREMFRRLNVLEHIEGGDRERFKGCLILPVWQRKKIVSIQTRKISDNPAFQSKWLNLPNGELVTRKYIAWPENLNRKECFVTEAITDALTFINAGYPACALLGTSEGQDAHYFEQAKGKLYFALDPDKAGREASYKLARKHKGYVLDLGHDKDPDEVLAELGPEGFKALVDQKIPEARYYLDLVIEREGIAEALREIAEIPMASEQDKYLSKLADKHGVTVRSLRKDMSVIGNGKETHPDNENIICDPKPKLHPAMDILDGNLIYGTYNQVKPIYLSDRKIIDHSVVNSKYLVPDDPRQLRFSANAIKDYLNGRAADDVKLFDGICGLLEKHLVFRSNWQIVVVALWIIGTYFHRGFPLYPYLWIQSPTKRCGKTRLLEIISELSFNADGIQTAPTQAVLYRVPTITAGTLAWDEAENLYSTKEKGERLEILNAAYRKGSQIPRCEGEDNKVKFFEVYRPIVLAGISSMPDTVQDRALKIELIRKSTSEKVERLQTDRIQGELQKLRDDLHIFALERTPEILAFYNSFPSDLIPDGVDDRLRDALEIIYSIGACIRLGKDGFPLKPILTEAAKDLSGVRDAEEDEISFIRAIGILRDYLFSINSDETMLPSKAAISVFQEGGLDWVQESKHASSILKKLGFRSKSHRTGGKVVRGYRIERTRIDDLSKRYLGEE